MIIMISSKIVTVSRESRHVIKKKVISLMVVLLSNHNHLVLQRRYYVLVNESKETDQPAFSKHFDVEIHQIHTKV